MDCGSVLAGRWPVTSIKVLPARRQIAAFVINPHFKSKKVGVGAAETSLP